jgi:16S rRNA (cytidine1402-2'-O)-methyltransferase
MLDSPAMNERAFVLKGLTVPADSVPAGLHLVATPIGNLGDITVRALATLARADLVLAEDTRVTGGLLQHFGIRTTLRRFDRHAEQGAVAEILARLREGATIALVSDAGTPLVSDPGHGLVVAAIAAGHAVHALPGASAVLPALQLSGIGEGRFHFEGFLPQKQTERRRRLRELASHDTPLVLFEAPHRLADMLADAVAILGDRPAAIARELTKMFEEVRRGPLGTLAADLATRPVKGEIVVVIDRAAADAPTSSVDLEVRLARALETLSVKDAAALVAAETGLPRRAVYACALRLAAGGAVR